MTGQLPNDQQAIRLLQRAYNIAQWEAALIHYRGVVDWWTQGGNIVAVEADGKGYKELEPEPVQEGEK